MPNTPANFITNAGKGHGSSLYYVTNHWVIRCSGNNTDGRKAETFIRKRTILYVTGKKQSHLVTLGSFPREGGHDGNTVNEILDKIDPNHVPKIWVAGNGVSWQTAVAEIDAAIEYAQETQYERASRVVGEGKFARD